MIFVVVDLTLFPYSVRTMVVEAQPSILRSIASAVSAALHPVESINEDFDSPRAGDEAAQAKGSGPNMKSTLKSGVYLVAKDKTLLDFADGEPTLWRKRFSRRSFEGALAAEKRCLSIISALGPAFDAATATTDAVSGKARMPRDVVDGLVSFASAIGEATFEAADAWLATPATACLSDDGGGGDLTSNAALWAYKGAAAVSTPLIAVKASTANSLMDLRDALLFGHQTKAEAASGGASASPFPLAAKPTVLGQSAALGWMAVSFLSQELTKGLAEAGACLRDAKAQQAN